MARDEGVEVARVARGLALALELARALREGAETEMVVYADMAKYRISLNAMGITWWLLVENDRKAGTLQHRLFPLSVIVAECKRHNAYSQNRGTQTGQRKDGV